MINLQTTLCTFSIINFSLYLYSLHRHAIALKCKICSLEILLCYMLKNVLLLSYYIIMLLKSYYLCPSE